MTDKDILDEAKVIDDSFNDGMCTVQDVFDCMDELIQEVEKLRARNNGWMEETVLYLEGIDSLTKERDELRGLQKSLLSQKLGLEAKLEESQDELKEFKLAHEYCHLHGDDI